ncbi:phage-related protein [Paenibacillus phyllosphaerae]|uniref:Phage-related protein n=1 Tax=Paenibacillus phyllosphaerae TaxID=274593 RepID=A0A7W5FPH7_9BACL|nr:SWIM zinc finger family protein [Paenibacillus phyllosphaerae]MBB3112049.1 phage-related protein [Paenibacillus phyllosphaerae]
MVTVTEAFVDSIALNASAAKNGRDLVKKNSFTLLNRSEDGSLLFGECKGSGKEPYRCSADFAKPESPVYRCSCPSRQFPCKHVVGLLFAYAQGKEFAVAPIPDDIADKREKAEKREEKRQTEAEQIADGTAAPAKRKVNKSALVKKLAAQQEGAAILEKLVLQLVQNGIASVDAGMLRLMKEQAKQLGGFYVPGFQAAVLELSELLSAPTEREQVYTEVMDRLTVLHTLMKRSKDYLAARAADPELPMETATSLEERIGHAWQLTELRELGHSVQDVELIQLGFLSYADTARGEYVDEGYWLSLKDGASYTTKNLRPFRAAKFIKEEDSCFQVMQVKELFIYPGDLNPRVRFEESVMRETSASDTAAAYAHAKPTLAETVKLVKNQLKNPLADRQPWQLVKFKTIGTTTEGVCYMEDEQGTRIALADLPSLGCKTTHLFELLSPDQLENAAALVLFEHDLASSRLLAQPISIITPRQIIRLLY